MPHHLYAFQKVGLAINKTNDNAFSVFFLWVMVEAQT
jgi:hypothetical protein